MPLAPRQAMLLAGRYYQETPDVFVNDGAGLTAVSIEQECLYYVSGGGQTTGKTRDLLEELEDGCNAALSASTVDFTLDRDTGEITFAQTAGAATSVSLLFGEFGEVLGINGVGTVTISGGINFQTSNDRYPPGFFAPRRYLLKDRPMVQTKKKVAVVDDGTVNTVVFSKKRMREITVLADQAWPYSLVYNEWDQLQDFAEIIAEGHPFRVYRDRTINLPRSKSEPFGFASFIADDFDWNPDELSDRLQTKWTTDINCFVYEEPA